MKENIDFNEGCDMVATLIALFIVIGITIAVINSYRPITITGAATGNRIEGLQEGIFNDYIVFAKNRDFHTGKPYSEGTQGTMYLDRSSIISKVRVK